jgi:hypothetical protein
MELIHKAIIERREVFEALGAGFFESSEEKHLCARIELFQYVAELSHSIAACRHAQDIVNQALNKLLSEIFAGQIAFRELSRCQKFVEGDGLCGKRNQLILTRGHAEGTPLLCME